MMFQGWSSRSISAALLEWAVWSIFALEDCMILPYLEPVAVSCNEVGLLLTVSLEHLQQMADIFPTMAQRACRCGVQQNTSESS